MKAMKGPRGGDTNAAGKLRGQNHTLGVSGIQGAAVENARVVRDVEQRCLSSIFHGLPGTYDVAVGAGLTDAGLFAFVEHRAIFRVLMADGLYHDDKPSIGVVCAALEHGFDLHFEIRTGWGGTWDELSEILHRESIAAGLENYARLVVRAARRRAQVGRLWRALAGRAADPFDDGKRIDSKQHPSIDTEAVRLRGRVVA